MRKKTLVYLAVGMAIATMVGPASATLYELTPTVSGRTLDDGKTGFFDSSVIVGVWSGGSAGYESTSWLKFDIPEYPDKVITQVLINSNIVHSYGGPHTPGVRVCYVSNDSWTRSTIHNDWPAGDTSVAISSADAPYPALHNADIISWLSFEGEGEGQTLSVRLTRSGGGSRGGLLGKGTPSLTITALTQAEINKAKAEAQARVEAERAFEAQVLPADLPPDFVPLGVYLSWELPSHFASYHHIDRWEDIGRRLDAAVENHVNTLWVTNMCEADLPRLIRECEKRGIKLLASMSTIEGKIDWRWHDEGKYYDAVVPRVVELAGDSKTFIGWVLSDEPLLEDLPRIEQLRLRFRRADPDRFCLVVSMWPQTPHVPKKTNLPVVCVNLYPFFGPNNPHGPHTDAASRNFFRTNARRMFEAIGDKNAVGWVMSQCFIELWGPYEYDRRGHIIALPGAFLHWRQPTLAEMRWQVWETFRSQGKGVIIFQLAPIMPIGPDTAKIPSPDIAGWGLDTELKLREALIKKPTDVGLSGLTKIDGTATPQMRELGKVFKSIAPHTPLIRRWEATPLLLAEAESPGSVQSFIDPLTQRYYCVVVNNDLHERRSITLHFEIRTTEKVLDLITGKQVPLTNHFGNGSKSGIITLDAGDGTILEIVKLNPVID